MAHGHLSRGFRFRLPSIVGEPPRPRRVFGLGEIEDGWLVEDTDGLRIGRIAGIESEFLAVSRGFMRSRLYVPLSGVREVTEGTVRLNLTMDAIEASRWSQRPRGPH